MPKVGSVPPNDRISGNAKCVFGPNDRLTGNAKYVFGPMCLKRRKSVTYLHMLCILGI